MLCEWRIQVTCFEESWLWKIVAQNWNIRVSTEDQYAEWKEKKNNCEFSILRNNFSIFFLWSSITPLTRIYYLLFGWFCLHYMQFFLQRWYYYLNLFNFFSRSLFPPLSVFFSSSISFLLFVSFIVDVEKEKNYREIFHKFEGFWLKSLSK